MVSSDLGKLDAQRHLISGPPWAKAGAVPAARMPAIPAPAVVTNFLRSMSPPREIVVGSAFRERKTTAQDAKTKGSGRRPHAPRRSLARDGHAVDEDGA